ncbi:MAG: radical SAM family heme chaperone HemW [Gallionellaceae bacterium]|nr:radical SAM family heme chaperone HemW [Gallionellaceae bacterium]
MTAAGPAVFAVTRPDRLAPAQTLPLSLYVHVPWCVRKCPYCDFNSHALRDELPEAAYLDALSRDLEHALPEVWRRPVETVFIGGGTPSLLSPEAVDRLLTTVRTLLPLRPGAEITLEANPGTFELARFRGYREAGVNRLSLGIQSFDDRFLKALGRIHDGREAHAAISGALALFERVNLDLMYALPGQTPADLARDLAAALGHAPQHLSCYHLTLEPNTAFAAAPPVLPDDDAAATMQDQVEAALAEAGYQHYETSAYARPGLACRHNLNYWQFGDYLGIGAGAHSKLSFPDRVVRQARPKHPKDYLAWAGSGRPPEDLRVLGRDDLKFEFMMNALRLNAGFDDGLFMERTGLPLQSVAEPLREAQAKGLLERDGPRLRPSEQGRRFLNDLLQMFLE